MSAALCIVTPLPSAPHGNETLTTILTTTAVPLRNFTTPFQLKQLHAQIVKRNAHPSNLSFSHVAQVCAFSTDFAYARQLLQFSDHQEIVIWNSCIRKLAESDSPITAIQLFRRLRFADVLPDSFTCSFILKACSRIEALRDGKMVQSLATKLGWTSDVFLLNNIVHLYACCGDMDYAQHLFEKMPQKAVVTWNIMITQFAKKGDIQMAGELFNEMPERNVRSWTTMIAGYVQCGKPYEAINIYRLMEDANVRLKEATVVSVLVACADTGALDLGQRIHTYARENGFHNNVRVCNTLIDMYTKCGCIEEARKVFAEMRERTVVSWSAMIMGLAIHGLSREAIELFSTMQGMGIHPNAITFIGLLYACSHMGLVHEGRQFFEIMVKNYRIVPQIEHYGCMVDLLSRSGLLDKAYEYIENLPIEPSGVVWGALLGGCRVHKNVEMAQKVTKRLLALEPGNDGYYVVLSNIYAEAGRWDCVAKMRRLMKGRGIKKETGSSSITVDGITHVFVAGDSSRKRCKRNGRNLLNN